MVRVSPVSGAIVALRDVPRTNRLWRRPRHSSAGAFSCLLARRGYPPFQKRCDFWRWSVRSVVRQERVGAACCVWFAGALQLPGRLRGVQGGSSDRAHTVRRGDAFAVARGSVWAVMAARLDCRTDSALTIKTGDRNVCAGVWGPGAKADGAAVWGVIWSGRAVDRGSVTSFPKTGEQRRKRLRARSADAVVWQSSRACSAGGARRRRACWSSENLDVLCSWCSIPHPVRERADGFLLWRISAFCLTGLGERPRVPTDFLWHP